MSIGPNFREQTSVKFESKFFIQENASENVVCEMAASLSRGRWVNKGEGTGYTQRTELVKYTVSALLCFVVVEYRSFYLCTSGILHRHCDNHMTVLVNKPHDVIKWKHFPRYWPFVRGNHRWIPSQRPVIRSVNVFFDLRLTNGWINIRDAGNLRCHRAHYDVTVMPVEYR